MSKIKALITALVLTGSTAAMAAPSVSFSANASVRVEVPTVHITTAPRTVVQAPIVRDHRQAPAPVIVRDHRTETPVRSAEWVGRDRAYEGMDYNHTRPSPTLATSLSFDGANGYRYVYPTQQTNNVRNIRLQATGGDVYVKQFVVRYTDDTTQNFQSLDRELRAGQSMDLQLNGKQILRIAVYANGADSSGLLSVVGF